MSHFRKILISLGLAGVFSSFQASIIPALSQSADFIDGKIINSVTEEPVPFTTIRLKNNQLGVFANSAGDFKIFRNLEFQNDSLVITCIGYKRFSILFKDLKVAAVNKIYISPAVYGLGEVKIHASISAPNPVLIISRALRKITDNYPVSPFNYISYYRDYQKRDGNYINLNEAIVQTLDCGFASGSYLNKYRMLDFKDNADFPKLDISPFYDTDSRMSSNNPNKNIPKAKLGDQFGNELFVLMIHDAIRNFDEVSFSFINNLSRDFTKNHNFSKPTTVYNNNLLLYKVAFTGRPLMIGNSFAVSGAIYIQPEDYSIHKLEYSCSYLEKKNEKKQMFNVDIEYGYANSIDSLMCLKYISFNNIFYVIDKEDITYFRVLKSYLDTRDGKSPVLNIDFNYKLDPVSAMKKDNYQISVGGKSAKITDIRVDGKNVKIRLKGEKGSVSNDTCYLNVLSVKDFRGNLLNSRKKIELYQYRELFVQEYNKPVEFTDSCYLQYLPLNQNCISKTSIKDKYWMNTPENIKNIK